MMGIVHFEQDIHVHGHDMSIDVHFLPTGMYYILCTNADGFVRGKFFKQ